MAMYMQIPGIEGTVSAKGFKNWITVDTLDFAAGRNVETLAGQTTARIKTKTHASEIVITKSLDKSSPLIFTEACVGKAIPEIKLALCHTGDSLTPYMQYTLYDVFISQYKVLAVADEQPIEWLSLNFSRMESRYTPHDAQHRAGAPISAQYNIPSSPHSIIPWEKMPVIPDWVVNSVTGFGDTVSFGLTHWIRDKMHTNDVVDEQSLSYKVSSIIGYFVPVAALGRGGQLMYKVGYEFKIGKNLRIAPFGNRNLNNPNFIPHKYGQWPHYHRQGPKFTSGKRAGQSMPGQSMKRHRPFEPHPNDKSLWDRF